MVDARDEEVLVGVRDPEQLVAHRATDDVRVEAERADIAADLGRHGASGTGVRLQGRPTGGRRPRSRRARRREARHLEGRARRGPIADPAGVDLVHRLEVAKVDQEHARLDELLDRAARRRRGSRRDSRAPAPSASRRRPRSSVSPGFSPSCPATKTRSPATIAWLYGAPWNGAGQPRCGSRASPSSSSFVSGPAGSPAPARRRAT